MTDTLRKSIESNLKILYDEVFNGGKAERFYDIVSSKYIQHNPMLHDGAETVVEAIKKFTRIPCEIKRIAIEGDLAFVHCHYKDGSGLGLAVVDIFRVDSDGKIAEHWDVAQKVPENSVNSNGMF